MEKEEIIKRFYSLQNTDDICKLIEIPKKQLRYILFVRKNNYREFSLKKRANEYRKISSPKKT